MHDSKRIIKNAQLVLHTNRAMKPDNKCRNPVHLHCSRKPVERQIMINEELYKIILSMLDEIKKMSDDDYFRCKLCLLAVSDRSDNIHNFVIKLFDIADKERPIPIEMRG